MKTSELIDRIVAWIRDYCERAGLKTLVVGVSGGVDSSAIERLCERTGLRVICVAMPMYVYSDSAPLSLQQAMRLCLNRGSNVEFHIREIGPIVEAYRAYLGTLGFPDQKELREGNMRSRVRANILDDIASANQGIVVGTGNRDEDEIGYFTKRGDGAVDICPLSQIHKSKVREIARELGVPADIVDQNPTAGLWDGQTDEGELGIKYSEVEAAIRFDDLPEAERLAAEDDLKSCSFDPNREEHARRFLEVLEKVRRMRRCNAHKLHYPPVFPALELESAESA